MSLTVTMQAPTPSYTQITCRSGNTYQTDQNGLVQNVAAQDVIDLIAGGYTQIGPGFSQITLAMLGAKNTDGSAIAAAATSGKFGSTITLGTSAVLVAEVANGTTVTDSVMWDVVLPDSFPADYSPTINVNCNHIIGSGTITTHTLAMHAYPVNADGTMGADIVTTVAQNTPAAAAELEFATGPTTLLAGGRVIVEGVVNIIETSTHAVGFHINSITID